MLENMLNPHNNSRKSKVNMWQRRDLNPPLKIPPRKISIDGLCFEGSQSPERHLITIIANNL